MDLQVCEHQQCCVSDDMIIGARTTNVQAFALLSLRLVLASLLVTSHVYDARLVMCMMHVRVLSGCVS